MHAVKYYHNKDLGIFDLVVSTHLETMWERWITSRGEAVPSSYSTSLDLPAEAELTLTVKAWDSQS